MAGNKILLTAFCGTSAELLVNGLELDSQYKALYLPNDKIKDSELLTEALKQERFDYVISLGQRPNIKDKIHIETRARQDEIYLNTAFECTGLKKAFENNGIETKLSGNAGTSFCNELYWNGLRYLTETRADTKMVFVHMPFEKNISDVGEFGKKLFIGLEEFLK